MLISPLVTNNGVCPHWNVPVCVRGWYRKENNEWKFLRPECPIIKNSKLPLSEQEPRYKLMRCHWEFECPLMQFQPHTTSKM